VQEQFKKVKHAKPMMSLNDGFTRSDIYDWQKRITKFLTAAEIKGLDYFAMVKADGLAASLIYKKGILQRGSTRGNGKIGEDVTHNLKTIESIPLKLTQNIDCEVRGEVHILKKDFIELNKQRKRHNQELFANPRNAAAGGLRQLDSKIAKQRKLSFVAYQIIGEENKKQEFNKLKDLGFKVVENKYCVSLENVFDYFSEIKTKREKIEFNIDGLVIWVNKAKTFNKLGVVGKAPRGAIAFKFPMQEAVTIVLDIKLQIGRTGAVTPVAVLKPVEIGGAVISRATLHNQDEIKRLQLKIGDSVIVGRAGDVIPKVFKVLKDLRTGKEKSFKMPKNCPVCGGVLTKKPKEAIFRCTDSNCILRRKRQLYHFVSKGAFDIEGLGPKVIDQLLKENIISVASDIFEIKQGDIVSLERFGEKSAQNLIESINKAKYISLSRFIFSLGIRGVGEETGTDLANHFLGIEKIYQATKEQLLDIPDIGPETADGIYEFFKNGKNKKEVNRLIKAGVIIQKSVRSPNLEDQKLKGKTFVLTGTMETLSRDKAKEKIRRFGGNVSSSVSRNIDFVVAGDNPGSKINKAKEMNISIIGEKEFLKMI